MLGFLSDPHRRHRALTLLVAVGLVVYLSGKLTVVYGFDLALMLALVGGFPIYTEALLALVRGRISADLAVGLAAMAALYIGQYAVAAEVILIMLIGEALEHYAIDRTRTGIAALLALRPHTARVRLGDHEQVVPVDEITLQHVVILRPGDRIPVDGRVLVGSSSVDQSPITGESLPADKTLGDEVFAGTINLYGALELAVERLGKDTTLEQIIHLVEQAEAAKAPTQRLADRYAAWFVPIVLLVAAVAFFFTRDVVRSVAILVVACPCALVLATPTAIAAAMGALVRRGVLIKGGAVLEDLGKLRCVVFDKTGTLTLASLRIARILTAQGYDEKDVLRAAAAVEHHSEHPVGRLIVDKARADRIETHQTTDFVAHPGLGAEAKYAGHTIRVGSPRFLLQAGIESHAEIDLDVTQLSEAGCTVVLVADNDTILGAVAVEDTIRGEARAAIEQLKESGIQRIVMLTGDNRAAAQAVGDALAIDEVQSELMPADKAQAVRRLQAESAPVAMVGDGINDAPALVAADVGVAMAEIGTDVAISSADVVLMGDDLGKLLDAVNCSRRMRKIIWQNILGFALLFNVAAVAAASLGWVSPVAAALLHQVSSLIVVLNSLRLLIDLDRWTHRAQHLWEYIQRRRRRLITAGVAFLLLVYGLSGIHIVNIGQVAVVQRFGRILHAAEQPGLHCRLPWPMARHTIVRPKAVRRVEIGFRTLKGSFSEPPAYEWNVQHRGGRHEGRTEEATILAGDESLADVNLVVHYQISDPAASLVLIGRPNSDGSNRFDTLVRNVAEASLHAEMSFRAAEDILGSQRADVERRVKERLTQTLAKYSSSYTDSTVLSVKAVCLGDVHPPLEVVPAFREVASAMEEKEAKVNQARAYRFETEAKAEGEADEKIQLAEGYREDRVEKASGEAARFVSQATAYGAAPKVTRIRLHLDTIEQTFAGRRKVIVDGPVGTARRRILFGPQGIWNLIPPAISDDQSFQAQPLLD